MDAVADDWRREMPEHDSPELELIMRAGRLTQLLEEALSECLIPWNLTKADFGVLRTLRTVGAPYELRPTDICNRLLLTSGGVSNVINRLERLGLAKRIPDRSDGRISWVRLSRTGTEVAEDAMRAWSAAQRQMFAGVDPPLARQASDALRDVLLALGDREPPAPATRKAQHLRSRRLEGSTGVDYGLSTLSRHRANLLGGMTPEESAGRAVGTAGGAVAFAARLPLLGRRARRSRYTGDAPPAPKRRTAMARNRSAASS